MGAIAPGRPGPGRRPGHGHVRIVVKCPGCECWLPEDDLQMQAAHMESEHPEIVAQRRAESERWDGWVDE